MKKFEMAGFAPLTNEDCQNLDGGGLVSSLVGTVEGLINPLAAMLDSLISSLPIPALPGLSGIGLPGLPGLPGL